MEKVFTNSKPDSPYEIEETAKSKEIKQTMEDNTGQDWKEWQEHKSGKELYIEENERFAECVEEKIMQDLESINGKGQFDKGGLEYERQKRENKRDNNFLNSIKK